MTISGYCQIKVKLYDFYKAAIQMKKLKNVTNLNYYILYMKNKRKKKSRIMKNNKNTDERD